MSTQIRPFGATAAPSPPMNVFESADPFIGWSNALRSSGTAAIVSEVLGTSRSGRPVGFGGTTNATGLQRVSYEGLTQCAQTPSGCHPNSNRCGATTRNGPAMARRGRFA